MPYYNPQPVQIRPLEMPKAPGMSLKELMALAYVGRGGGRGGSNKSPKVHLRAVRDPDGSVRYIPVYGETEKERSEEVGIMLDAEARNALRSNPEVRKALEGFDQLDVDRQSERLDTLRKTVLPKFEEQYGVRGQNAIKTLLEPYSKLNKETRDAIENSDGLTAFWDSMKIGARNVIDGARGLMADEAEKRQIATAGEKYIANVRAGNAALTDLDKRRAQGDETLDILSNFGSNSALLGELMGQTAPQFAGGLAGAAIGGAVGGPAGAVLGGAALGGLMNAPSLASEAAQNVVTQVQDPAQQEAALGPAMQQAAALGAFTGGISGLIPVGRIVAAPVISAATRLGLNAAGRQALRSSSANAMDMAVLSNLARLEGQTGVRQMARNIAGGGLYGGLEEMGEQIGLNTIVENATGVDQSGGLMDSFTGGALLGAMLGASPRPRTSYLNARQREMLTANALPAAEPQQDTQVPNTPPADASDTLATSTTPPIAPTSGGAKVAVPTDDAFFAALKKSQRVKLVDPDQVYEDWAKMHSEIDPDSMLDRRAFVSVVLNSNLPKNWKKKLGTDYTKELDERDMVAARQKTQPTVEQTAIVPEQMPVVESAPAAEQTTEAPVVTEQEVVAEQAPVAEAAPTVEQAPVAEAAPTVEQAPESPTVTAQATAVEQIAAETARQDAASAKPTADQIPTEPIVNPVLPVAQDELAAQTNRQPTMGETVFLKYIAPKIDKMSQWDALNKAIDPTGAPIRVITLGPELGDAILANSTGATLTDRQKVLIAALKKRGRKTKLNKKELAALGVTNGNESARSTGGSRKPAAPGMVADGQGRQGQPDAANLGSDSRVATDTESSAPAVADEAAARPAGRNQKAQSRGTGRATVAPDGQGETAQGAAGSEGSGAPEVIIRRRRTESAAVTSATGAARERSIEPANGGRSADTGNVEGTGSSQQTTGGRVATEEAQPIVMPQRAEDSGVADSDPLPDVGEVQKPAAKEPPTFREHASDMAYDTFMNSVLRTLNRADDEATGVYVIEQSAPKSYRTSSMTQRRFANALTGGKSNGLSSREFAVIGDAVRQNTVDKKMGGINIAPDVAHIIKTLEDFGFTKTILSPNEFDTARYYVDSVAFNPMKQYKDMKKHPFLAKSKELTGGLTEIGVVLPRFDRYMRQAAQKLGVEDNAEFRKELIEAGSERRDAAIATNDNTKETC